MGKILRQVKRTRHSRRYFGYIRVYNLEYRKALIQMLQEDGADLIELFQLEETIRDLEARVEEEQMHAVAAKLTRGISDEAGVSNLLDLPGQQFNLAAENYYRGTLRKSHMKEALELLQQDFAKIDSCRLCGEDFYRQAIAIILPNRSASDFFASVRADVMEEKLSSDLLNKLIQLVLLSIYGELEKCAEVTAEMSCDESIDATSVYRT
jgi:hypothetical protein